MNVETAYLASEWIIRLGALAVVPSRRSPAAAGAWLLLIFFLPLPGLLAFLAIGSPRFPRWRQDRFGRLQPYFRSVADATAVASPVTPGPVAALAGRLGGMPVTAGNAVELLDDYDATIDRLIADIDGAKQWVHLLVYIFADDAVGVRVADALARARRRGVPCRMMFDPLGSIRWRRGTLRLLRAADVETREALPFHLLRGRTRRDMRNHRKLFVIDGRIGYAGSLNIVAKDFRPRVVNRELVARVAGPVVAGMAAVVRGDWAMETDHEPGNPPPLPPPAGSACLQLLPSGPDYPLQGYETLLVWQLHEAREQAVIVTPYFVPDEDVLGAMRTAVARGVRVDLVVSAIVDQPLVNLAQCSYYDGLLRAGVRIHRYRDFLLHAKNVCIDDRLAIVGSSNVDMRSFQLNQEASLLLHDRASVAQVRAIQQGYLDGSDLVELESWRRRPRLRRVAENVARLVSSLL